MKKLRADLTTEFPGTIGPEYFIFPFEFKTCKD
jgi:hypothetical protein